MRVFAIFTGQLPEVEFFMNNYLVRIARADSAKVDDSFNSGRASISRYIAGQATPEFGEEDRYNMNLVPRGQLRSG